MEPSIPNPTLRILQIECELAQLKRAYIVDGVETPLRRRVTLEAELAELAVQRYHYHEEVAAIKNSRRLARSKSFVELLCKKVEGAGLKRLIDEARAEVGEPV